MKPIVMIHGYSAESDGSTKKDIKGIYGDMPQALRSRYGAASVVEIDLARYISLDDGISIDDVAYAMDRDLVDNHPKLFDSGFHCIVHSTGALVIKNWLRNFSPKPSPLQNLVHLAGANFGSGWAHVGKTQFAKWGRKIVGAGERGVRILHALELASSWTIDLHTHFLQSANDLPKRYGVYEHVVVGSQADVSWYEAPVRYAKEDGSDGVVRVAASNLNYNYVRFEPTDEAIQIGWKEAQRQQQRHIARGRNRKQLYRIASTSRPGIKGRPVIPFAIPYECAHSGDEMGVVTGNKPRGQVLELIDLALKTTPANWQGRVAQFDAQTKTSYAEALVKQQPGWFTRWISEPRAQYDAHAQIVFRIRDQDGRPVEDCDVFFDSLSGKGGNATPLRELMETTPHINSHTKGCLCFYLRTDTFNEDDNRWESRVADVDGCHVEVTATEAGTDKVCYLPFRFEFTRQQLANYLQPHRTTILDIELLRVPSDEVYRMVTL